MNVREHVVHLGKPRIRADRLDVQEATSRFTQQHRSRNYPNGRWCKIGRNSCAQFVGQSKIDELEPPVGRNPMRNTKPKKTKTPMADMR